MRKSLSGTRIREQRRKSGMTQKALAEESGISASYLNLIEHNRRAVAGKVLLGIARVLNVPPGDLSEGVESSLIAELRQAAAHLPQQTPELATIEELTTRFPGWARLLTTLYRQTRDQDNAITALSDRLTHDPFLAQSLHSMLSNITAIRSTSNILKNIDDIEPDKQARFHVIIHEESRRLSDAAEALTTYFDHATDQGNTIATPDEALDAFLAASGYCFGDIDALDHTDLADTAKAIENIISDSPILNDAEARQMAQKVLIGYAGDAKAMPLKAFSLKAKKQDFNPVTLAQSYATDLHSIFRRLTHLNRPGNTAPPMGLVITNAAGRTLARRPLPDFSLPRHGSACPLWPLYQSFSQPERPVVELLELPGQKRFITIAVSLPAATTDIGALPRYHAAMLIIPFADEERLTSWLPPLGAPKPVGISCRICPREACAARSEPQILGVEM